MESTTFYRIQIDQPNVFLFISENGSYKSGSKRVTVQLRTAVEPSFQLSENWAPIMIGLAFSATN